MIEVGDRVDYNPTLIEQWHDSSGIEHSKIATNLPNGCMIDSYIDTYIDTHIKTTIFIPDFHYVKSEEKDKSGHFERIDKGLWDESK